MKKLFSKKKRLINELREVGILLDKDIYKRWGFHYSQTDDDSIIDTLDYGTDDIPYKEFVNKMDEYKKKEIAGDWKPNN